MNPGSFSPTSSIDASSPGSSCGQKPNEDLNVEARHVEIESAKEPAKDSIGTKQSASQGEVSKLNAPWKIQRSEAELEKKRQEILALDKNPMKALQKALLMPEFFTQEKSDLK